MSSEQRYEAFDLLATLVALAKPDGTVLFVNAGFEAVVGLSRRALVRTSLFERFTDAAALQDTLLAVAHNEIATGRLQATLRRGGTASSPEDLPVHVIVTQVDARSDRRATPGSELVLVEMIEVEQQTRQDREERALDQIQANRELIRNLAHEIKNPLGGIRGAAQLLAMELGHPQGRPREDRSPRGAAAGYGGPGAVGSPELIEYTEVIVHEADRLQALVDRLLAPHRRPHLVGDVNIHEVCERVRSVVLAEFPRGLTVARDYDVSLPEFRGDREQLIQALLNIVQNAAHALGERVAAGDARIVLRTRVQRQVTIGKQRCRLALELHVEDNGPGVPDAIRDRIFYPLVSGRDGGSGLGLTLAQMFVQQHHGSIDCDSVPGRTVFKIVIPLP
ncbi:MAG: PAS domain-containing sensor histidine kinase [Burkholderiaceae bacterium]|nr:PAS domain-containing sensor histidine kinase [Burkholderiaceae bacterium]